MEFFFTAFGAHNKYIVTEIPDHGIYPLSKATHSGLDLDYTALMLGKSFAIDSYAYDFVISETKSFLAPMAKTLQFLNKEGLLSIINFSEIIEENFDILDQKLSTMLEESIYWFEVVQSQWLQLKKEFFDFHQKYGDSSKYLHNVEHFGVVNYLASIGEIDNQEKLKEINYLLKTKKKISQ